MARTKIRWKSAGIIVLLGVLSHAYLWLFLDKIRQWKLVGTMITIVLTAFLLLLWLLFFSGARWKTRLSIFSAVVIALVFFNLSFRIKEVSGDLIPIFTPKWKTTSPEIQGFLNTKTDTLLAESRVQSHRDYPQFLGQSRTAIVSDVHLNSDWQANPPLQKWRQPIGEGWSAFAVASYKAVTQEQHGDYELVVCYDVETGKKLWQHKDRTRFDTILGGVGPRATPTIDSSFVFAQGATGILNCLDLRTGAKIWSKNILHENQALLPEHGVSASPLVVDSLLIICAGGQNGRSLVAYNKRDGKTVWSAGDDSAAYSSPLRTTLAGLEQILMFTNNNINSHNPLTGAIFWSYPWRGETQKVAQPVIFFGNRVFISTGYGVGSKMLRIDIAETGELTPFLAWESNRLKSKFANVLQHNGFIYGLDDGIMACIDPQNGKRKWKRGRYGHGQLILIGDTILVQTESGEVVLVETNPDSFSELARFPVIDGKTWNHPAFASPYLLVRNGREAACYELSVLN